MLNLHRVAAVRPVAQAVYLFLPDNLPHQPHQRRVPFRPALLAPALQIPVHGPHGLAAHAHRLEVFGGYPRAAHERIHIVQQQIDAILKSPVIAEMCFQLGYLGLLALLARVGLQVDHGPGGDFYRFQAGLRGVGKNRLREHVEAQRVLIVGNHAVVIVLHGLQPRHVAVAQHVAGHALVENDVGGRRVQLRIRVPEVFLHRDAIAVVHALGEQAPPVLHPPALHPDPLRLRFLFVVQPIGKDDPLQLFHIIHRYIVEKLHRGPKTYHQPVLIDAHLQCYALAHKAIAPRLQKPPLPAVLLEGFPDMLLQFRHPLGVGLIVAHRLQGDLRRAAEHESAHLVDQPLGMVDDGLVGPVIQSRRRRPFLTCAIVVGI